MKIACVGGGPAGLYFGILMKKADPRHEITVYERNRSDDTFGFGVVFSDATLGNLSGADPETYGEIAEHFAHWDDIHVHYRGDVLRSSGHGFCGLERQTLLLILQRRCLRLGVNLRFETDITQLSDLGDYDLVVAADGINSVIRQRYAEYFRPTIDAGSNKFVWLGTDRAFEAFTFYFKENAHGLFRVHAYPYQEDASTFIVECNEDTWRRAGLDQASERDTIAYLQDVFADELEGHRLINNHSVWRNFPTVSNQTWHHQNIVLIGDAAHTAHFSIGSGTKLAMEDCIELVKVLNQDDLLESGGLSEALENYERARRPEVESLQQAAQVSLEWFENTERYMRLPSHMFGFSLLTRSLRLNHRNLRKRDRRFVAKVERAFADGAYLQCGLDAPTLTDGKNRAPAPPPMFTPYRLRDLILPNRVIAAPMIQGKATDGIAGDWHLMTLGSMAAGGAGLVMTEMAAVSMEGRVVPESLGLHSDECIEGLERIVRFIHEHTEAKIGLQLGHAGRRGAVAKPWADDRPADETWPLIAASAIPYRPDGAPPRAMSREDIDRVREAFALAAKRAASARFDLLELQLAGGFLLHGFLSPLTNQRDDEYGGSFENRLRFPLEVLSEVRKAWPANKPLSVRLSVTDWHEGGITPADAVEIAKALKQAGVDIITVTSGENILHERIPLSRLYQTPFSDLIRNEADIPSIAVGGIESFGDINSILAAGRADLCAIGRGHLFDPHFAQRAAKALGYNLPWPKPYATASDFTPR